MRNLLCVLWIAGAALTIVGCSSDPASPPPSAPNTDLGAPGALDKGAGESTGSTTN